MTFMSERSIQTQLSIAEVEKVAGAIRTLADVFELSYQEMTERLSEFMTEREFKRVSEEVEEITS